MAALLSRRMSALLSRSADSSQYMFTPVQECKETIREREVGALWEGYGGLQVRVD